MTHCRLKFFSSKRSLSTVASQREISCQGEFLWLSQKALLNIAVVGPIISALLDCDNVRGAAIGGEQIRPVLGGEQSAERLYAGEQANDIVLTLAGVTEDRRNEIVPDAAFTKVNLQTLGNKRQQLGA